MGFSKSFYWGTASADYQVEGSWDRDGKGPGIWDALSEGHIKHGEDGRTSCDHYRRWREDIALMRQMGMKAYRFSVSWARIVPAPGKVNEKGLRFYRNLVTELTRVGITPMVTLYHWNLPMWAHERGGWLWEGISDAFADFVSTVVDALSDKVDIWLTVSDPATFINMGYMTGEHAPFETCDPGDPGYLPRLCALTRNVLLAHGKAVRIIRGRARTLPRMGIAMDSYMWMPEDDTPEAMEAARTRNFARGTDCRLISWWMDPILSRTAQPELDAVLSEEDYAVICQPLDFLGCNCFKAKNFDEDEGPNPAVWPGMPRNATGWPITPEVLYWAVRFYYERYRMPVLITANGLSNTDFVMIDGCVHDPQRVDYLHRHLRALKRAVDEGYPVLGYLYWSLFDCFEWAEGYDKRYGMVYVDFRNQSRVIKDSAFWYARIIRENGENL